MARTLPVLMLIAALSLCACAAPQKRGSIDPAAEAPEHGWMHRVRTERNIPYGNELEQTLDLYLQGRWTGEPTYFELAQDPRPTLLFIHGGGWMVRDRSPEAWVLPFVRAGWHVVSMTYRLGAGTAPQAVHDGVCALDWLVRHAGDYGFDRAHVVIAGASAGGHLALTTGILGSRPGHECYPGDGFRVQAVINWFGITDIAEVSRFLDAHPPEFGNYARQWAGDEQRLRQVSARYSPVRLLDETSPPVLTIHGTDDFIVPFTQAIALHERLDELGVENELLTLEGGTHAGFTDAQFAEAFATMVEFAARR